MASIKPTVLLLHDDSLLLLAGHEARSADSTRLELAFGPDPDSVALLARQLLVGKKPRELLLLLPPSHFIATPFDLPGVAPRHRNQALQLQSRRLLGPIDEELLVVSGVWSEGEPGLAVWIRAAEAEDWFAAFARQELFLKALAPRPFCLAGGALPVTILDGDRDFLSLVSLEKGVVRAWHQVARADLADPEVSKEWNRALGQNDQAPELLDSAASWQDIEPRLVPELLFLPPGAEALLAAGRSRSLRRLTCALALGLALLVFSPLLVFKGLNFWLEAKAERLREANREIIAIEEEVARFERDWAPIREFPALDLPGILATLERVLPADTWLSALLAGNGEVEIEGVSADAARLLESLATEPGFLEPAFSRGIRPSQGKEQFGIRFRLEGGGLDRYLERYFPAGKEGAR